MRNKNIFLLLLITFFSVIRLRADEGMWLPIFLEKYNIADMKAKGFKLTAEDIYSVNNASMKDAVMVFGGGCTGELISDAGLLITNHHCGYYNIVSHSTVEKDYLTNGFWAMSQAEELSNPGLTVTFLIYMEDVTAKILKNVTPTMTEIQRDNEIEQAIKLLKKETEEKHEKKYTADIKPFYYGNQYYMFVEQEYKDVRLVGAPPSAVGKFGGDTDNWMWPRHTGDFSLFRIYADKNNEPAEYSPDNVPYKPKKFFPISIKGVKEGDFTMVFGYPGRTEEYLPSHAVRLKTKIENPSRIKIRTEKLDIINFAMNSSAATRIQYASKQSSIANGWKKWIGESRGLRRMKAIDKKETFEQKFVKWANSTPELKQKYGNILEEYKNVYSQLEEYQKTYIYITEAALGLDPITYMSSAVRKMSKLNKNYSKEELNTLFSELSNSANIFFEDFDSEVEKEIFAQMLTLYYDNVDKKYHPYIFETVATEYKNDFKKYTKYLFENSVFLNKERLLQFYANHSANGISQIENGNSKGLFSNFISNILDTDFDTFRNEYINFSNQNLVNDPLYQLYESYLNVYYELIYPKLITIMSPLDSLNRVYMAGQLEMQPEKVFYPDANFTLRVTYGKVAGYKPYDAVTYKYYTTLDGIMEKDNPEVYDYNVPKRLRELYKTKDYGQYADADGNLRVAFIGTNHTTGGNSGSPVLDAEGNLIGLNFDRSWESTMSDVMYDPDQCRNIALDIRYALFMIDKFAGAKHLIDEMKIIKN